MPRLPLDPLAAVSAALRQRSVLGEAEHRPWPPPERGWLMGQTWRNLLFAHWRMDPEEIARHVPPQLPLDIRDGTAWVGVTPFRVEGLRLRGAPPPPVVSRFGEVNVRTYVTVGGRPGIYFLSLDASSRSAVFAARRGYRLPYFHARVELGEEGDGHRFRSERTSGDGPPAELECSYRPRGGRFTAEPGSLEEFLTERYCLYTLDADRRVLRGEIHHPPWPLQGAEASFARNTMLSGHGLALEGEPICHFAARQDVVLWAIEPADG